MKVLFAYGDHYTHFMNKNKGDEAIVAQTIKIFQKYFQDAHFVMFQPYSEESGISKQVKIVKLRGAHYKFSPSFIALILTLLELSLCWLYTLLLKCKVNANIIFKFGGLLEFRNTDLILYVGGDGYSQEVGFLKFIMRTMEMNIGLLLNKPIICFAESMGPFNNWHYKAIAKFVLNRVTLITLREEESLKHLKSLSLKAKLPVYVTACPAFTLQPSSAKRVKNILINEGIMGDNNAKVPIIGITPNSDLGQVSKDRLSRIIRVFARTAYFILPDFIFRLLKFSYLKVNRKAKLDNHTLAVFIDKVIESLHAKIILIPHDYTVRPYANDLDYIKQVYALVKHKESVYVIRGMYSAEDIKGLIGHCDIFIGEKLHACIAAMSQYLPTIGISYSYKFIGIFQMLGQKNLVNKGYKIDDMLIKLKDLLQRKEQIRLDLENSMKHVTKQALINLELVKEFLVKT